MSNRLNLIASFVKDGIGIADVGTDHAYLPIMLAQRGYMGRIIGTDINRGPIEKARRSLLSAGFENRVELMLCDGLDACESGCVDTVVVAGMGGDTITGILDRAGWCAKEGMRLILQPVTKSEILRYWLINNGFRIITEAHTEENGTLYQIIVAEPGADLRYKDCELFIGRNELVYDSPYYKQLILQHIKRFEAAVIGLCDAKRSGLEPWLRINDNILSELREMQRIYDENRK